MIVISHLDSETWGHWIQILLQSGLKIFIDYICGTVDYKQKSMTKQILHNWSEIQLEKVRWTSGK